MLLLVPLCIAFVFYFAKGLRSISKRKAGSILAIRSIIFTLIIFGLAGISFKTYVNTVSTIFAIDLSESTREHQEEFRRFTEDAIDYSSKDDRVGVITFGKDSEVEKVLSSYINSIEFQTKPGGNYTNIENSLRIAQGLIPQDTMKRIVLLTDGEENMGDSLREGIQLKSNNIDLRVYKPEEIVNEEVQLNNITLPKELYENQSFEIIVELFSNIKTEGKITLYSDREIVGEEDVVLQKGINRFLFRDMGISAGFKTYKAIITPEKDTITQNNTYSAYTEIRGIPRVLLIDGENYGGRELEKILRAAEINVDYIRDKEAPKSITELSKYSTVIMTDVSLENLNSDNFLNSLKSYIGDYGGGLIVTGGENSYALGGYYKTSLEEVLPVDMEMKTKGEIPNLGLMLVIDKSGSMSGNQNGIDKMEMAKEAAIRALGSLKPKDKIGVVAFDNTAQWVVKLTGIEKNDDIEESIGSIRAGGGTSIIPALDEAYLTLKDADTKLKHIILLTDGQAERTGYDQLVKDMRNEGITISTVAVGSDSDVHLLESIAKDGRGRYYFVDEFSSIPQIFTKETFLASKTYINNRIFTPAIISANSIITPLVNGSPSLMGYISTSIKDRAELILASDSDEPVLAAWQYGLGRSVAWTSDINGKWTSEYLASKEGIELFKNMVEWTFPRISSENLSIESKESGDEVEIIVMNRGAFQGEYRTQARIITPSLDSFDIELKPSRPGEYRGRFKTSENGVYLTKVNQYDGEDIISTVNHGVSINYSKEYDFTSSENKLNSLVNQAEGKFITKAEEVFTNDLENVQGMTELSRLCLIIAFFLFIIDIALRRLNLKFRSLVIENGLLKGKKGLGRVSDSLKGVRTEEKTKTEYKNDKRAGKEIEAYVDMEKFTEKEKVEEKIKEEKGLDTSRLLKAKNKRKQ